MRLTIDNLDEKSEEDDAEVRERRETLNSKKGKKTKGSERNVSDESRTIERQRPSLGAGAKVTTGVDPSLGKKRPSAADQKLLAKQERDAKEAAAQKRAKERQQSGANKDNTFSPRNEKNSLQAQRDTRTNLSLIHI